MNTDKIAAVHISNTDSLWKTMADDAAMEIKLCQDRINSLRKSLNYFIKQERLGKPVPQKLEEIVHRQQDLS